MSVMLAGATGEALAVDLSPQPVSRVDVTRLADAYRGSKIIGAPVVNDSNESIGKIDDLLIGKTDQVLYAVVSVGGFLGVGSKLVAVPFQSLQFTDHNLVLTGATKDTLKTLPEYKYVSK
jgi:hypothetical protein